MAAMPFLTARASRTAASLPRNDLVKIVGYAVELVDFHTVLDERLALRVELVQPEDDVLSWAARPLRKNRADEVEVVHEEDALCFVLLEAPREPQVILMSFRAAPPLRKRPAPPPTRRRSSERTLYLRPTTAATRTPRSSAAPATPATPRDSRAAKQRPRRARRPRGTRRGRAPAPYAARRSGARRSAAPSTRRRGDSTRPSSRPRGSGLES